MKIYPHAEFRVDFPEGGEFDKNDKVIVPPGGELIQIISGILTELGYELSPPDYDDEHGWQFDASLAGRRKVWLQVTQGLEDVWFLSGQLSTIFQWLFRRKDPVHAELLSELHRALRADPRFRDFRWWADYDFRDGPAEGPLQAD